MAFASWDFLFPLKYSALVTHCLPELTFQGFIGEIVKYFVSRLKVSQEADLQNELQSNSKPVSNPELASSIS
jgi:hypothetical protein